MVTRGSAYETDGNSSGGNGSMHIQSSDGKTVMDFNSKGLGNVQTPDYAPLYPGAKVDASIASGDGGGMVAFETSDSQQQVMTFYKQKTASAGLVSKMDMTTDNGMVYLAQTADEKKMLQVAASKQGTTTHAQITWANKK